MLAVIALALPTIDGAAQNAPHDVSVSLHVPARRDVTLSPGQSAAVSWRITNLESVPIDDLDLLLQTSGVSTSPMEYQIAPMDPNACGEPVPLFHPVLQRFIVSVSSVIPAGGHVTCRYTITRSPESSRDLDLFIGQLCPFALTSLPCSGATQLFGYLPDFALSIAPEEPVTRGATHAVLRVRVDNPSRFPVNVHVGACASFTRVPFVFEMPAGPEACALRGHTPICFAVGAPFGIEVGDAPAGGHASCLLGLRFDEPLDGPAYYGNIVQITRTRAVGVAMIDPNDENNYAALGVTPEPIAVPSGRAVAVLLTLLLAWFGIQRLRKTGPG